MTKSYVELANGGQNYIFFFGSADDIVGGLDVLAFRAGREIVVGETRSESSQQVKLGGEWQIWIVECWNIPSRLIGNGDAERILIEGVGFFLIFGDASALSVKDPNFVIYQTLLWIFIRIDKTHSHRNTRSIA